MTEQYAGKLLLDYVKWAEDENANLNDCPFDAEEVFEAMRMGGSLLINPSNKLTWKDIRTIGTLWVESHIEYGEDGKELSEYILNHFRPYDEI